MGSKRLSVAEEELRRNEAIRLRALRFTLQQIADQLGYADPASTSRAIDAGRKRLRRETNDELLMMELSVLDDMQRGIQATAINGDDKSITALLKIMDMRAKLVGLYPAPLRAEQELATDIRIMLDPRLLPVVVQQAALQGEIVSLGEYDPDGE